MNKYVIIVAGGSGKRMGSDKPKQFVEINKKPILMHTIEAFYSFDRQINIIVVLPFPQIDFWKGLIKEHKFKVPHKIIQGGEERFYSVKNGLDLIKEEGIIAVHDGVRPLVSKQTIKNCYDIAIEKGNAIPAIDINDSVRKIGSQGNEIMNRNNLKLIQTPQIFKSESIKKAYLQDYQEIFTDDASVVENNGEKINLVDGNIENIKITMPIDLVIAEAIFNSEL